MFDPHAYGDEIAGILALDGNGERLMPLAGATCSSVEARRLLKAGRTDRRPRAAKRTPPHSIRQVNSIELSGPAICPPLIILANTDR